MDDVVHQVLARGLFVEKDARWHLSDKGVPGILTGCHTVVRVRVADRKPPNVTVWASEVTCEPCKTMRLTS